jgi:hypothetical protein
MNVILSIIYAFWLLCSAVIYGYYTSFVGNLILGTTFVQYPELKGRSIKVSLIDVYILVAQLGIIGVLVSNDWLSAIGVTIQADDSSYALLLLWPELVLCWYLGLRTLRRTGPTSQASRFIFLAMLIPSAFGGLYFTVLYNIVVPDDLMTGRSQKNLACVLMLIWFLVCRYLANFLLQHSRAPEPAPVDSPP